MILTNFLGNHVEGEEPYQVVVIGAGYDTRSLRRQGPNVNFYEVDLPEIVDGKGRYETISVVWHLGVVV
jgi:O-methyltransferase involved in polyketide biosynthesis